MGGFDTKGRFHVHWGAAEQYAERREESALRRSGRPVPDPAYTRFDSIDTTAVDDILEKHDFDGSRMLAILESIQAAYGYLPVAALKRVSQVSGAPYALIYGTAELLPPPSLRPARAYRRRSASAPPAWSPGRAGSPAPSPPSWGRRSAAGRPRAELPSNSLPAHIPGAASPLVTLDGKRQAVGISGAAAWARALFGRSEA